MTGTTKPTNNLLAPVTYKPEDLIPLNYTGPEFAADLGSNAA